LLNLLEAGSGRLDWHRFGGALAESLARRAVVDEDGMTALRAFADGRWREERTDPDRHWAEPAAGYAALWRALTRRLDGLGVRRRRWDRFPRLTRGFVRRARLDGVLDSVRRWLILVPGPDRFHQCPPVGTALPAAAGEGGARWWMDARRSVLWQTEERPAALPPGMQRSWERVATCDGVVPWGLATARGVRVDAVPGAATVPPVAWADWLLARLDEMLPRRDRFLQKRASGV
jgi:hypothetical protein